MRPVSGRRHQLRLHLICLGHPIVGDATYSSRSVGELLTDSVNENSENREVNEQQSQSVSAAKFPELPRMMLHAFRLQLPMEKTCGPLNLQADEPFSEYLEGSISEFCRDLKDIPLEGEGGSGSEGEA